MAAWAQEEPVYRAGVSLVKLDVQVVSGGRLVTNLSRDDFIVLDEGQPQEIVYFGRESEPLWVLLLLDVSGSMGRFLQQMAAASREALSALNPGDHAAVMVFGRTAGVTADFTEDFAGVAATIGGAVKERRFGASTRLNAAIIEAARHMEAALAGETGRRAIVILTDNGGLNYQTPNETVARALFDADAVLNAIVVGNASPPREPRKGAPANPNFTPSDVFALARETGGAVIEAKRAGAAFKDMMESVRTRYSIHYRAPAGPSGAFRRVEVQLAPAVRQRFPRSEVRARSGYYY